MTKESDWNMPFAERYLAAADAITVLDHWLSLIGLSGNVNFERMKTDFIRHGGETFNDIRRDAAASGEKKSLND